MMTRYLWRCHRLLDDAPSGLQYVAFFRAFSDFSNSFQACSFLIQLRLYAAQGQSGVSVAGLLFEGEAVMMRGI